MTTKLRKCDKMKIVNNPLSNSIYHSCQSVCMFVRPSVDPAVCNVTSIGKSKKNSYFYFIIITSFFAGLWLVKS